MCNISVTKRQALCLLLSLLLLLPLTSCQHKKTDGNGSSGSVETAGPLAVVTNGITEYVLIIPENAPEEVEAAAVQLQSAVKELFGCLISLKTDYLSWADSIGTYEILIGGTNRDESALTDLKCNDFSVVTVGKKIVIRGGGEAATVKAVTYFIANCIGLLAAFPGDFYYRSDGTYPVKAFTLCGRDISEYVMVYPDNAPACETYAKQLQMKISSLCGTVVPIRKASGNPATKAVICFGRTDGSDCASDTVDYDSFVVKASEGKVSVLAGSKYAYLNAISGMLKSLNETERLEVTAGMLNVRFDQPAREEYISDPDAFLPVWSGIRDTGTVTSFEEKISMFSDPQSGHLLTIAHRGEHTYYPEDSVESMISTWKAGVFAAEIDLRFTADGIAVLMHDGTLTRMTNYDAVKGTVVNGVQLPNTSELSAWTYEQLSQLRLKAGSGGNSATVTDFQIASLEDILTVTKGRLFLYIDNKTGREDLLEILYPLMQKTGNYQSVLLGGSTLNVQQCVCFQQKVQKETGCAPLIYTRASTSQAASVARYLKSYAVGAGAILLNGEYYTQNKAMMREPIQAHGDSVLFGAWTLLEGDKDNATEEMWREMYQLGFRIIMCDRIFELLDLSKTLNN